MTWKYSQGFRTLTWAKELHAIVGLKFHRLILNSIQMVSYANDCNFVIERISRSKFSNEQLFISLTANATRNFIMGKKLHTSENILWFNQTKPMSASKTVYSWHIAHRHFSNLLLGQSAVFRRYSHALFIEFLGNYSFLKRQLCYFMIELSLFRRVRRRHSGFCERQKCLHCAIQRPRHKQPPYGPIAFYSGLF